MREQEGRRQRKEETQDKTKCIGGLYETKNYQCFVGAMHDYDHDCAK